MGTSQDAIRAGIMGFAYCEQGVTDAQINQGTDRLLRVRMQEAPILRCLIVGEYVGGNDVEQNRKYTDVVVACAASSVSTP